MSENDRLHTEIDDLLKRVKISRSENSNINRTIEKILNEYVSENKSEVNCCYFIKNIDEKNDICFVHKFDGKEKTFQNLKFSEMPIGIKEDDVIVYANKAFAVNEDVTNRVLKAKKLILNNIEESFELFTEEGKEYIVCDKSDDILKPRISLKTKESGKEYVGITVSRELYEAVKVSDTVIYEKNEWKIV